MFCQGEVTVEGVTGVKMKRLLVKNQPSATEQSREQGRTALGVGALSKLPQDKGDTI